ncbi:uncharacterized protein LOC133844943 [Drosophila sulfurigaster albostrigata]|uniref:uncharacterized protein LOC133844943 n=1 Tax=Drosophila sulfurigaster albostrigata TaxID=89887 RepID=UPI002D21CD9C|nr:uncharacterized protein LOC133844943 [Drosophila sulfurigaster albostrigata]
MSAVPKTDEWMEFFSVYGRLPALWKVTDEGYKSKRARIEGYKKLLKSYQKIHPGANVDNMRRKMNGIRACFRRELRKVERSELSARNKDDVYKPQLWYFKELSFLRNDIAHLPFEIAEDTIDVVWEKEDTDEEEPMDNFDQKDVIEIEPISVDSSPIAINTACPDPIAPVASVAPVAAIAPRAEQPKVVDHQVRDEANIFAEGWAVSYRKLDAHNRLLAKKAIEEILVLGQLNKLQFNSVKMP